MTNNKYPIPIYLNQKYVFDILAMIEGGFNQIESVKTKGNESSTNLIHGNADLGVKNVFAFLGVSLKGGISKETNDLKESEVTKERIHTPNSLFARMRESLLDEKLVRTENYLEATPGDFIEFKITLRKNPIIDALETVESLMNIASIFTETEKGKSKVNQSNKKLATQIKLLLDQLKSEGSVDLIGENIEPKFKVVLTIGREYLGDPSLSEIVDGEFSVIGKVTKIITKENEDSVNLLRKTSLSKLDDNLIKKMFAGFESMTEYGVRYISVETSISGPVIQIIPIGIFS